MRDYQRILRRQLRQLERQRAFLPPASATPPGSVLMNVLVAVLEETEEIRRRIALVDLASMWIRSRMFSSSILATTPIEMEADSGFTDEPGEWTLPGKEEI